MQALYSALAILAIFGVGVAHILGNITWQQGVIALVGIFAGLLIGLITENA